MGSNSVLLWAVILVGLLITFLKLNRDGIGISRIRNLETPLDETIWVLIQGKGQSFLLCNTYRSDYSDNQYELIEQLGHSMYATAAS
jgi:hypothetical protein